MGGGSPFPGSLLDNLLLFGRLLRSLGLDVDPGRMIELVQALGLIEIRSRVDFYHTLRSLLVHRQEDLRLFDRAFDLFWQGPAGSRVQVKAEISGAAKRSRKPLILPPPLVPPAESSSKPKSNGAGRRDEPPLVQVTLTYSDREALKSKDFASLNLAELEAIQRFIAELTWQVGLRRSRRFQTGKNAAIDPRRSLRRLIHFGGEQIEWVRKEPIYKPRPLVILADISGSMERYTRLLLHFAYGISRGAHLKGEIFVFSTRLTRITHQLHTRNIDQALRQVSMHVPDWSGGTRIGEAIKTFNFTWGQRVLGRGAVVLLISDGWDCGDAGLLRQEMARLQHSCHRLIWLNPLLGQPGYEPLTRGMQTALPYIDDFLPVHNLASLDDLAARLQRLDESRPARRQVLKPVAET